MKKLLIYLLLVSLITFSCTKEEIICKDSNPEYFLYNVISQYKDQVKYRLYDCNYNHHGSEFYNVSYDSYIIIDQPFADGMLQSITYTFPNILKQELINEINSKLIVEIKDSVWLEPYPFNEDIFNIWVLSTTIDNNGDNFCKIKVKRN